MSLRPSGMPLMGTLLSLPQKCSNGRLHRGHQPTWVVTFIFTCKPDSHPTLYERLAFWQATDGMAACEGRRWNGRFTEVTLVRYINDVLLRHGADTLSVNWFDITVVNAKTG